MRTFDTLQQIDRAAFARGTAVAIGKFDGVHRGHGALLGRVRQVAETRGLESLVFTFANHPFSLLKPDECPPPIMSPQQRREAFAEAGIDACVMVPFDAELASVPAEQFVEAVLVERLQTRHLCVGADFRFGYRGRGNAELLRSMGRSFEYTVEIIDDIEYEDLGRVSSSRIREAILRGEVADAARMMGHPVEVRGVVVRGDARGRELGFPTANLGGEIEGLRPADGVYAAWAFVSGQRYEAAVSVGANVTFNPGGEPRVEAHLIDFSGDLYGERIELQFARRLRGMVAFDGVQALVAQMGEDVSEARAILADN